MSHRVRVSVRALTVPAIVVLCSGWAAGASLAATLVVPGQAPFNQPVCCTPRAALPGESGGPDRVAAALATAEDLIQRSAFSMLRPEHQARLASAGVLLVGLTSNAEVGNSGPGPLARMRAGEGATASLSPLGDEEYAVVRRIVRREVFDGMLPVHQRALVRIMEDHAVDEPVPAFCFSPTTDGNVVEAFQRAANGPFNERFQQGGRWSTTATNTTPTGQGDRVTLTYSFVPDGTSVPNLNAGAATSGATSNLFAFLNGLYGSPAVWQALYQQVFTRWNGLIGVDYVLETNDDGVAIAGGSAGVIGVRGDLRLAGTLLDGPSNVLAFNYFPGAGVGGDMVIDTGDTFYNNLGSSSVRLRNVLAHEHGHGLGMAHVCPVNSTKLMEPFISTAYDGPQFDDILNGQRHYGDSLEPSDTIASAVVIATLDGTLRQVAPLLSIDDAADTDVFRFEVASAGVLTVIASPQGSTYLDGPQNSNGSCSAGVAFDALRVSTLSVAGLNSAGATLQSASATGPGSAAVLSLVCPIPGTYYARVSGGLVSNIQAYRLSYSLATIPAITITATPPALVSPSGPTSFNVQIQVVNDTLAPATARLFYRSTVGAFQPADLVAVPGTPGSFIATLPSFPCGSSPAFYVSASTTTNVTASFPAAGAASPRTANVGDPNGVFSDDFETDRGWTFGVAGDTATTGLWLRAVPVGTSAQPGTTPSGTRCAVTGNATAGAAVGTNDVDTGFTTLLSPRFDLAGALTARVSYARWYTNNLGSAPNTKVFAVDISSDDGASWTRAETVGPASPAPAWITSGFDVPGSVGFTANMRVRFIADDTGAGSVVEAGVDDFSVTAVRCVSVPPPCPADFDSSGVRDVSDIFAFLSAWFAGGPGSDFDTSGTRDVSDIFAFLSAWFAGC